MNLVRTAMLVSVVATVAVLCASVFIFPPDTTRRGPAIDADRHQDNSSPAPYSELFAIDPGNRSYRDVSNRKKVDCRAIKEGPRVAVIFIFGQSNAGNYGDKNALYAPARGVYNFDFFDGACYEARDPLLGTETDQSNVATRLGDLLVQRKLFDQVIIIPIAYGGSAVAHWAPGGILSPRLNEALRQVRTSGLAVTLAIWQQGETDAHPPSPDPVGYKRDFRAMVGMLRRNGMDAPIAVAQSTVCQSKPIETIRQAQRELVDSNSGILAGADTDSIGMDGRFDGCHFSEAGLNRAAELWFEVISHWKSNSLR